MTTIFIKVYGNFYKYDEFLMINNEIVRPNPTCPELKDQGSHKIKKRRIKVPVDGILIHYVVQEFNCSPTYCQSFIDSIPSYNGRIINVVKFIMQPPSKEIIDYGWNYRTSHMARERAELDHALSWLSTLGGAYSALGDHFSKCAEVAGKISFHQFMLAMRLGDPNIETRCRLYFSLSLIQRNQFKLALKILQSEFANVKESPAPDLRVYRMCLGIHAKLKYEHYLYSSSRSRNRKSKDVAV